MSFLRAFGTCLPCGFFRSSVKSLPPSVLPQTKKSSAVLESFQKRMAQMQQYFTAQRSLGMSSSLAKTTCALLATGGTGLAVYYFIPGVSECISKIVSPSSSETSCPKNRGFSQKAGDEEFQSSLARVSNSTSCQTVFSQLIEGQSAWTEAPGFVYPASTSPYANKTSSAHRLFQTLNSSQEDGSAFEATPAASKENISLTTGNGSKKGPSSRPETSSRSGWLDVAPWGLLGFAVIYSPNNKNKEIDATVQPWQRRAQQLIKLLPYLGLGAGLLWGFSGRNDLSSKSSPACKAGFSDSPLLEMINGMKQLELKTIAYLTPFVTPAVWGLSTKLVQERSLKPDVDDPKAKISTGLLALWGLGLAYPATTRFFSSPIPGYKLSGHFLLKTVSAGLVSSAGGALSQKTSGLGWKKTASVGQAALITYSAAYAASDAIFLANTATHCHTVAEVVVGLVMGLGLIKWSRSLVDWGVRKLATH